MEASNLSNATQIYQKSDVMPYVLAGVAILDKQGPSNWRELVRDGGIETLTGEEMKAHRGVIGKCGCVIGRCYGGSFISGLMKLELTTGDDYLPAFRYGFACAHYVDSDHQSAYYEVLAKCWRDVIGPGEVK